MGRRSWTGAMGLAMLLIAAPSRADDTHYQDYPLGGRAVGLGGAFGALADDPSGLYYNPAGIVDARHTSIQLSSNLYGLEISDSFFAAVEKVANLDTVFAELNIIPSSAAFITPLGGNEEHPPKMAYGFGAFVPSYRGVNIQTLTSIPEADAPVDCDNVAYQRSLVDRTFLAGGAFAYRLDDTLSFGVSGFAVYRSLRDQEETSCFTSLDSRSTPFATAATTLRVGVAALMISLGMKANLGDGLTFGLTVNTPSINILDFADVRVRRGAASPGEGTEFLVRELTGLNADTRFGTNLRAAAAYVIPHTATFTADLSVYAPTTYDLFEVPATDVEVLEALTTSPRVQRKLIANLNVGGEYLISKSVSVAGGLFTNFSSAPKIPDEQSVFQTDRLPHVHAFGGSAVLGLFGDYTLTRAGVTMSYGSGSDVVPRVAGLGALGRRTEYVKVDLSQLFIFFFVASTFRY